MPCRTSLRDLPALRGEPSWCARRCPQDVEVAGCPGAHPQGPGRGVPPLRLPLPDRQGGPPLRRAVRAPVRRGRGPRQGAQGGRLLSACSCARTAPSRSLGVRLAAVRRHPGEQPPRALPRQRVEPRHPGPRRGGPRVGASGAGCSVAAPSSCPRSARARTAWSSTTPEDPASVLKLAKPRPYSREHVRLECELTEFFAATASRCRGSSTGTPTARFCVKERLAGKSLAAALLRARAPGLRRATGRREEAVRALHRQPPRAVRAPPRGEDLGEPEQHLRRARTASGAGACSWTPGRRPFHDYSHFSISRTTGTSVIPQKIEQYRVGGVHLT